MAQVTIYLDEDTEKRMGRAGTEAGLSRSRCVAELIRDRTARDWPEMVPPSHRWMAGLPRGRGGSIDLEIDLDKSRRRPRRSA